MSLTRNMLEALHKRWMHFWFEPVEPLNLGLCRVLFFGALFLLYWDYDPARWADKLDSLWMPVWLFEILKLPVLSSGSLALFHSVWITSLATSCVGLFTRASTICSFILGVYLLGLPLNFGKVSHGEALVVFVLGIMALSRCGDSSSVDRFVRKARQGSEPSVQRPRVSGEYTWPVRVVWVLFALIFFGAGVAKLRQSGLEWIFSDNMAILLMRAQMQGQAVLPFASYVREYPWLGQLVAAGTIVVEVGYPLVLFSSRARWILVPGAFSMQIGISLLMGITFRDWLILNLFWVRWPCVAYRFGRGFRRLLSLRKRLLTTTKNSSKQDVV
jgi:HTTM domain